MVLRRGGLRRSRPIRGGHGKLVRRFAGPLCRCAWDPARPVVFIGREYFHGSFYETVFEAARRLLFP